MHNGVYLCLGTASRSRSGSQSRNTAHAERVGTMNRRALNSSVELPCPFCGEMGLITVDEGGGENQTYVEDCSVCCKPRIVHVDAIPESKRGPRVWIEREV